VAHEPACQCQPKSQHSCWKKRSAERMHAPGHRMPTRPRHASISLAGS
jgi:hypothetical protein